MLVVLGALGCGPAVAPHAFGTANADAQGGGERRGELLAGESATCCVTGALSAAAAPRDRGAPRVDPSRTLVSLGVPDPSLGDRSEAFRAAWVVGDRAVASILPPVPENADQATFEEWTRGPFGDWVNDRGQQGRAAEDAFRPVASAAMPELRRRLLGRRRGSGQHGRL